MTWPSNNVLENPFLDSELTGPHSRYSPTHKKMGGRQSRIDDNDSKTEDTDDWMSRVEVKPSMRLVARLEQQQRNQGAIGAATEAFKADDGDEERSKQEESSEHVVHQEVG